MDFHRKYHENNNFISKPINDYGLKFEDDVKSELASKYDLDDNYALVLENLLARQKTTMILVNGTLHFMLSNGNIEKITPINQELLDKTFLRTKGFEYNIFKIPAAAQKPVEQPDFNNRFPAYHFGAANSRHWNSIISHHNREHAYNTMPWTDNITQYNRGRSAQRQRETPGSNNIIDWSNQISSWYNK